MGFVRQGYSIHKLLGTEWRGKIGFALRTDGIIDVWNKKTEFLGILFYYKKWKEWCFIAESPDVFMGMSCMKECDKFTQELKLDDWEDFQEFNKIPEAKTPTWDLLQTLRGNR